MKKVSLFQSPRYQDRTYNHSIFGHSQTKKVEASMMFSRIECQPKEKVTEDKYILHKVARANRYKIAQYQQRKRSVHPNILAVDVDQTSNFYVTIKVEKGEIFSLKHLLMQQIDKRSEMLKIILLTAKFLSKLYGFFYITEKMLLYRNTGTLTLWINQNILENYSSFPINHSKMSEQFFISDFKANFIGNLRQAKALRKAKTIDNILSILHEQNKIFHSIYMSEPADRLSQIYRRNSIESNSNISCKNFGFRSNQKKDFGSNIYNNKLSSMKKSISFSYLPSQIERKIHSNKKSLVKTLANSISAQNLRQRRQSNNTLKQITNSITFSSILNLTSSSKNIRSSNLPIINFRYSKEHNIDEGWKKKKENFENKQSTYFSNFMSKSQSMGIINPIFQRNKDNQPLKVSFPSTISHSFIPYTQSEKISKPIQHQVNRQKNEQKGMNLFQSINRQQLKKEEAAQLQMDLQVLFSDSEDQIYSKEHMDIIMEEFENILLS